MLDKKVVLKALTAAGIQASDGPSQRRAAVRSKIEFAKRYDRGDHEAVWDELRALGATVREPPVQADARAVARATMDRVAKNLERICDILKKRASYKFKVAKPFVRQKDGTKKIDALEKAIKGTLRLSVRAFYEVIDSVSLSVHPDALVDTFKVDEDIGDKSPLVIRPFAVVASEIKDAHAKNTKLLAPLRDPLVAHLAPALAAKNDPDNAADGLVGWAVSLPDETVDIRFDEREEQGWFVDRLRAYIKRGGFLLEANEATLAMLTEGYEPF